MFLISGLQYLKHDQNIRLNIKAEKGTPSNKYNQIIKTCLQSHWRL